MKGMVLLGRRCSQSGRYKLHMRRRPGMVGKLAVANLLTLVKKFQRCMLGLLLDLQPFLSISCTLLLLRPVRQFGQMSWDL
jgi:hypothetical protein